MTKRDRSPPVRKSCTITANSPEIFMSIEQRIKRIEDAIKTAIENRDWLRSQEWRAHREANDDLGGHLDDDRTA
jgi:hypothetical protein